MTDKLLNDRIKVWVTKKIHEFLGEEEKDLIKYILDQLVKRGDPVEIIDEMSAILDKETEQFIIKLWRLIIYETEARRIGLIDDK